MRLTIATFNLRNVTDRYPERRPLLAAAFVAMAPDIAGLQEVSFVPGAAGSPRQDDLLADAVRSRTYRSLVAESPRYPGFGNAILVGVGEVLASETLALGEGRVAQRALIVLPGSRSLWFVNTHLHHKPEHPATRERQAAAICDWMDAAPAADATIVVGDFNTPPFEPAYAVMVRRGYRSAFREANGKEPAVTWPSGIQAATMDTEGEPNCLDYIWLRGAARAAAARLGATEHPPDDPTIFPSDHFAVVAEVDIG